VDVPSAGADDTAAPIVTGTSSIATTIERGAGRRRVIERETRSACARRAGRRRWRECRGITCKTRWASNLP
jgi:hypothetical protein